MPPGDDCTNPVDVTTFGHLPGSQLMCGCGTCPEPDPTPTQLQAEADRLWLHTQALLVSATT